jgi:hypothetical protein
MLKIRETTLNRLVIKSEKRNFDALMIVLLIYVVAYFLLISTLKIFPIANPIGAVPEPIPLIKFFESKYE